MKKHGSDIPFVLGTGIISFIFLTVSLTSIAYIFHGTITIAWLLLSLLTSLAAVYFTLARQKTRNPLAWAVLFLVLIFGSIAFSSATIDSTADGNTYHKTAVGELKNGWNPIWENVNTFNRSTKNPEKLIGASGLDRGKDAMWVNHYPKATWIFAAAIYKLTGNIESGKAITPLTMIALFLIAFSYLRRIFDRNKSLILSLLLTFNPIVVSQLYSYYNDGIMGNLIVILLVLLTMVIDKRTKAFEQQLLLPSALFMTLVLLINTKFTGLAYGGVTVTCYYVYLLLKHNWKTVVRLTVTGTAAVLFGVVIVGASSYIKNTYLDHNPFYPLAGKGKVDIITAYMPASYVHEPSIIRFLDTNLDPVGNLEGTQGTPRRKFPFTISPWELSYITIPDARQGGYGVWFGGILVVSLLVGLYLAFRYGKRFRRSLAPFLLPPISIAIIIVAFGQEIWWARYLPQLAVVPIVVIAALFSLRNNKVTLLPYALVFGLLFNVALTACLNQSYQSQYKQVVDHNFQTYLACNQKAPTYIYSSEKDGALYNIIDACKNVRVLTHQEFSSIPSSSVELYAGIYTKT